MIEEWRDVIGYRGVYAVSSHGRFRIEVDRYNIRSGSILKKSFDQDGYCLVALRRTGKSRQRMLRAARLVLHAFCGAPRGRQANHKNGERADDRLENLEWVTLSENIAHSIRELGRDYRGSRNPDARLTEARVIEMRERAARGGESFTALGTAFGVSGVTVGAIVTGKAWAHAGGPIIPAPKGGRRPRAFFA